MIIYLTIKDKIMSKVMIMSPESDRMKLFDSFCQILLDNKIKIISTPNKGLIIGFYQEETKDYEWYSPRENYNNPFDYEYEFPMFIDKNLFCCDEDGNILEFETDE